MTASAIGPRTYGEATARVFSVTHPAHGGDVRFRAVLLDGERALTVEWIGRADVPGVRPGVLMRVRGMVVNRPGGPAMLNPSYDLLREDQDD
ncbi:hypothetical protein [Buchananella felis]|uniref:hypothetical protein n=1 Tax=Buchananella felis TaxID=3231492 RepID=UPI003527F883